MSAKRRISWPDYAKGIGIFLVVLGHLIRSLVANQIIQHPFWLELDRWIYSFHMPLFFFLSGLFIINATKLKTGSFIASRIRSIAYPYFIWSIIQTGIHVSVSRWTTSHMEASSLLNLLTHPTMQFWFLYALFLVHISYYLLSKFLKPWQIAALSFLIHLVSPMVSQASDWDGASYVAIYLFWFSLGSIGFKPMQQTFAK